MASAHVHRNAEKLASIRATPRLVNILHAVGAELALRRASWPRSPPRSLSSSPSSNPADNEATKPTDERGNEQTGKARAWKECETRMGRKKKKKIGSRTSLPVGCRTRTTVHGAQVVAHASRLVHSWLHPVRRLPRRWPGPRARTLSRRLKFMNVANSRTGPRVPCRIYRRRAEYRRFIGYYIYMYIYTFTYKSV